MRRSRSCSLALLGLKIALLAIMLSVATSAPAFAQTGTEDDGPRVVLTGRVDVEPDERVETVVIFDGPAVIEGDVDGAVVAFNGDIVVSGNVDDEVIAFNGRAIIEEGATVGGDVVSSDRPRVAAGATVDGDIRRERFRNFFRSVGWALWLFWWLAVSVSVFVLGVLLLALVPRMFPPALDAARTRVGPSIGWGLALGVGLPIASVLVMFTVLGIPLGLIGLLSLALLYSLGYIVAALLLGRRLLREPRSVYLAFFVGLLLLRLVDLVPIFGNLVTFAASIYGVGALTIAAWRTARRVPTSPPPAAPTPAPASS
jgi:hypothetical protein